MSSLSSSPAAPEGFKEYTVQDTIGGKPSGEPFTEYLGPQAQENDVQLTSHWSAPQGVWFELINTVTGMADYTTDELAVIPELIHQVLAEIDLEAARVHLKANPLGKEPTVTDLGMIADSTGLSATAVMTAYMEQAGLGADNA